MAAFKNHHFVPKVYLRSFSADADARTVNMIHVAKLKAIPKVSLSDQCSKNYFYGKDVELEKALGGLEGEYGTLVRKLKEGDRTVETLNALKKLTLFQHFRTDAARKRLLAMQQELHEKMGSVQDISTIPFSGEETTQLALMIFFQTIDVIADLKTVIIVNDTPLQFVTSDHPAVLFNRFSNQKLRLDTFGLKNSGLGIYMPISPSLALVSYDANVYRIEANRDCEVVIRRQSDITALNAFVIMNDANCIYFHEWDQAEKVSKQVAAAVPYRCVGTRSYELRPIEGRADAYRPLEDGEVYNGSTMIYSESVYPKPRDWPKFLENKIRPVTFNEGTAAGHVRKREWLRQPVN